MEKDINFIQLTWENDRLESASEIAISPLFNLLCVINKDKDGTVHSLPDNGTNAPLWQCPSKSKSCLFSNNGTQLLFLLSVNSILIFKIDHGAREMVSPSIQIKTSVLARILQNHSLDYSATSKVKPLQLLRSELLVQIDGRFVCLEWGLPGSEPTVKFVLQPAANVGYSLTEKKLFLLEPNAHLSCYSLSTGSQLGDSVNLCLANRANSDISIGRIFSGCYADPASYVVAVVNQDQQVVLLEFVDTFERTEIKTPAGEEVKKERWSWTGKKKIFSSESKTFPGKTLGVVGPPAGVVVSHLQFSMHGLFIFYSVMGNDRFSCAKVVTISSGSFLGGMHSILDYSLVPAGRLPVFNDTSSVSICLGALSADTFIMGVCEILSEFCKKKVLPGELKLDQRKEMKDNPIVYAEFLKIVLSLHSNAYRSDLKRISDNQCDEVAKAVMKRNIVTRMDSLFTQIAVEQSTDLIKFTFMHVFHLFDLTCIQIKDTSNAAAVTWLGQLCEVFLERLTSLWPFLKHLDLFGYQWMVWRGMTELEVVQESVDLGTVALALVFFVCERGWSAKNAQERFATTTKEYITQLTSVGDLEKATHALNTIGCDPLEYFLDLCLKTNEPLLRDLLMAHLRAAKRLTDQLESAWKFCKQLENALSSYVTTHRNFEHKMIVSATESANIVNFKLVPYKGSLELTTVLRQSLDWRKAVITELYFATGDVTLESQLEKDLCWKHLVEHNCIDLLTHWVDLTYSDFKPQPHDYITKMLIAMLARWQVDSEMLNVLHTADCMTATRDFILDHAATYGVFTTTEMNDMPAIVKRLRNTCSLTKIEEILEKPTANVNVEELYRWFLVECARYDVKMPVLECLRDANNAGKLDFLHGTYPWLSLWRDFENWDGKDLTALPSLIRKTSELFPPSREDAPYVKIALAQVEGTELSEIIEKEGPDCDLLTIAPLEICWQSLQRPSTPDVTLYDLLAGSNLPMDKLFTWQTENTYVTEPHSAELFPHFNNQILSVKYGHKLHLDYLYYLKQSRPSFACNLFFVESLRAHRRLTTHMINRACGLAHGLALRLWKETSVGSACVAFIAMLGDLTTANALRLHLSAVEVISNFIPEEQKKYISNLLYGIVTKDAVQLQDMAALLEVATFKTTQDFDMISRFKHWTVPVTFCYLHGLPLPTLLPRTIAKAGDWYNFVLCLDLFKYPYDLAIELIEEMDEPILKAHLLRALTRTTLKFASNSPSKSPPRIRLEPESGGDEEIKDTFQAYVRNVYTEVLTTIQTFTDRNIVLPWSCEQNPDDDVLLTVLKCESEADPARALLFSALELRSPILALISTCYNVENIAAPLLAWLLASVPNSLPRSRLREEGLLLPFGKDVSPEFVQELLLQFFDTGYFQTFYRGMTLFLPDNPLTFVVESIYRCVVELDLPGALSAMKAFVLEMVHGQGRMKDAALGSREWILGTTTRLIESVVTRNDVPYSVKVMFLKVLADSEISSVDETFPKFLTWHQISEILEAVEVRLNFGELYDLDDAPKEIERCLAELFAQRAFNAALEIAALLCIKQDTIILALWEQTFLDGIKNNEVASLWSESSAVFKDEHVNPRQVCNFYHNMVSLITGNSASDVRNRYLGLRCCVDWRKFVEDTMLPSFREESDSIELEMWEVTLQDGFEFTLFPDSNTADAFAMLVADWPPPKLMVRAAANTAPTPTKVSNLITALLDVGDFESALRVSAFFTCEHQDLKTISSCLQVSLGELPHSELAQYNSLLSPKKLLSSAIDTSDFEGLEAIREPSPHQALLERLCASVSCGKMLAQRIAISSRLASALDMTFQGLASETDSLELLERAISTECGSKMAVARDVLWLARLPDSALATFLSERIVKAFTARALTGLDVPARLWDVDLQDKFHRIMALLDNPANLGLKLMKASVHLPFPEAVEVLIKAHDCYSQGCNVEGIGSVLRRARILSQKILKAQQWRHLVRLLVGIGRYSDMSYIFQMLKDNEQFEYLLRKGTTKTPALHIAVSDYLQRTCPENRELGKMVALAYGLHGHQAALWQADGDEIIAKLTPPLKDWSKVRQSLTLAMENYSHAALCYIDAGTANKALKVSKKAQVVAVQIALLGGPYVLNITASQLQVLAQENLSVAHIRILAKAEDLQIDWGPPLHERWILRGEKAFFNDFKATGILTDRFIMRFLQVHESDQSLGAKSKDRLKQLGSLLPSNNLLI